MAKRHPLRVTSRPSFEIGRGPLRIVDLFSGCGGLTLGVAQAANKYGFAAHIPLAVDVEKSAIAVLQANFPSANASIGLVEEFFDGPIGAELTSLEERTVGSCGDVDVLVGGPPCQGHSNLNNHTRRSDPKNRLYLRMVRAAEVLRPRVVLIENVPSVVHDSESVVGEAMSHLEYLGYSTSPSVVSFTDLGVPQKRKRHTLLAVRSDVLSDELNVAAFLNFSQKSMRDLDWAIRDLENASESWIDTPSRMSRENSARIRWLIENNQTNLPNILRPACHQGSHSYVSMYGRLSWDEPAQTITSGFGSMGQGRYGHPSQPRTLTPHEAARIQGFPDYFKFEEAGTKTKLSVIIGNAVPPALTEELVSSLIDCGVLLTHEM